MNIANYSIVGGLQPSLRSVDQLVSLDQRMVLQSARAGTTADPEFDKFYDDLMKWSAESGALPAGEIQTYLKQYTNVEGKGVYRTTQKQVDVLTEVMIRMKEQGLEGGATYKDVKVALVSCSSSNMFVQEFMQDVFKPADDEDDRENTTW